MASEDKKWRHHYVWQHYLKAWAGPDKLVSYRENGKSERRNTKSIAYAPDFYRLRDIPDAQMKIVLAFIATMDEPFQSLARGWIPHFTAIFDAERTYLASGIRNPVIEEFLDVSKSNLEEDLHGSFEGNAVEPLAALRKQDATPIQDVDAFIEFSMFLALQYFRTPKLLASVSGALATEELNVEESWALLRTILATNLSGALYRNRSRLQIRFLEAGPSSEFVTGDQPMLNLLGTDGLDLFYPLGPRLALRLTVGMEQTTVASVAINDVETHGFNKLVVKAAHRQIYASSHAALDAALSE